MKKLKGMKNDISSFENNKLNDLNKISIVGGTKAKIKLEEHTTCGRAADKITVHDSGRTSRLIVGEC